MIMLSRPSADYSHGRARKLLGYRPAVTLEKGMQRCEAWLRKEGMIN
jgi:nucleoside-diphosphate-sugar epimerase